MTGQDAAERVSAWLDVSLLAQLGPAGEAPQRVYAWDEPTIPIEDWPTVQTVLGRMVGQQLINVHTDGGETWDRTYELLVTAWVRGTGWQDTRALVGRYGSAILTALMLRRQADPAGDGTGTFRIRPESITVDYSPTLEDEVGRTLAGVTLTVRVSQLEREAPLPTAGTATTVAVRTDTATIPPHPALT